MNRPAFIAHYKILSKLGEGGMGAVYRATDTKLGRDVAIKILPEAFAQDHDRMARFEREAQVLAALNHPNIAAIYGVEEHALVMELVDGEMLSGPLLVEAALPIARQIADALEYAHEKGIIHRDLKPANIKVTPEGRVKVLDFGLAKAVSRASAGETRDPQSSPTLTIRSTQIGAIIGTAAYMSPEQARGMAADKRADIWSFGVVFYEMLTGRQLFGADTVTDALAAVLKTDPDWSALPPETPAAIRRLLRRCLERDRKRRLADIADTRLEIDEALAEPPAPMTREAHRNSALWWVAPTLVLALAVNAAFLWRARRPLDGRLMRFSVELAPDAIAGTNTTAAISADGTRLAFLVRGSDGKPQLATRMLNQSKATLLGGTENASDPFFSPEGEWIGFFADGKMKKIPVQGGSAITLCDASLARGASWAPDGQILASLNATAGIVRVPDTGGTPQPLPKTNQTGEIAQRWPQVLPGGEAVLYTAGLTPANFDDAMITAVSLKNGQRKIVIRGGYFGRYLPSGHLVYIHQSTLLAVPFDVARLEVRGSPVPLLEDVAGNPSSGGGQFDFSQTGTFLFMSGRAANEYTVAWLDSAGALEPMLATPGSYLTPRLSPDGKWLAISGVPAAPSDLWLYEWQRGALTRLTFTSQAHQYPVWTPDGKYIVYTSHSPEGASLWWMRADRAGQAQKLMESKNLVWPASFSPDGRRLAFVQRTLETSFDIWTLPLDTSDPDHPKPGQPEAFLQTAAAEMAPAFSPDGHWIAYQSSETGATQIYVRPFPGPGGIRQISIDSGSFPVWSRNGRELFYENRDNRIMLAEYTVHGDSFDAKRPRLWSSQQIGRTVFNPNLDLSSDGKRFVVFLASNAPRPQTGSAHVTFLLNFFDELRRRMPPGGK